MKRTKWKPPLPSLDEVARRALAEKIAAALFGDGLGGLADRLELKHGRTISEERAGAGWCFVAAVDVIEKNLRGSDGKHVDGG